MYSTSYLYGVEPSAFRNLPYEEAIRFKVDAAKTLFDELYLIPHFSQRDEQHVDAVYKAWRHSRKLLAELDPSYIA